MHLFNSISTGILAQIDSIIGGSGSIDFFTNVTAIPATGMLNTASRIKMAADAMPSPYGTAGVDPTGGTCTGTFAAMTTGVVSSAGTPVYFAILKTNTGALTAGDLTAKVLFTGSVGVGATYDLSFNTTVWAAADNVNITSLNFLAPQG